MVTHPDASGTVRSYEERLAMLDAEGAALKTAAGEEPSSIMHAVSVLFDTGGDWGLDRADIRRVSERYFPRIKDPYGAQPFLWAGDVSQHAVEWLWSRRIPKGELTVIFGPPGVSKSTIVLDIAARVSCGRGMYDDDLCPPARGRVLVVANEDSAGSMIAPRLELAGADMRAVAIWDRTLPFPTLPDGVLEFQREIGRGPFELLVLDPVTQIAGNSTDSHKDADVRSVLRALTRIMEATGCTVLGISHTNKSGRGQAIDRMTGSGAWVAVPRSTLACNVDASSGDPDAGILAVVKGNASRRPPALQFRRVAAHDTAPVAVEWLGRCDVTADELLEPQAVRPRVEAKSFLEDLLERGPVPSTEVKRRAEAAGITERTLRRAKDEVGVMVRKQSDGPWTWELPEIEGGQ